MYRLLARRELTAIEGRPRLLPRDIPVFNPLMGYEGRKVVRSV